jgi:hypothetical protein
MPRLPSENAAWWAVKNSYDPTAQKRRARDVPQAYDDALED